MSEAKIQIKLGSIEFVGEGEKEWVSQQLDKILERAPSLIAIAPAQMTGTIGGTHIAMIADPAIAQKNLATFLKEKNATTSQVKKFLATAAWLEAKGKTRMSTADVAKALKDSNQTRLGNPSDCLNQNVAKGHCEKEGAQFFVTVDGKASL